MKRVYKEQNILVKLFLMNFLNRFSFGFYPWGDFCSSMSIISIATYQETDLCKNSDYSNATYVRNFLPSMGLPYQRIPSSKL